MSNIKRRAALVIDNHAEIVTTVNGIEDDGSSLTIPYRPVSLQLVLSDTHFTRRELQAIYRAFKERCSSAALHRDAFRALFAEMFPKGDTEHYADLVFDTFQLDPFGCINFHDFVKLLSTLCRGGLTEKLEWLYRLYDPTDIGKIDWHRILHVITATDDLIGTEAQPVVSKEQRESRADYIFQKFDRDNKGWISKDDFISVCSQDDHILQSLSALSTVFPT